MCLCRLRVLILSCAAAFYVSAPVYAAGENADDRETVRVLAMGDSLTYGFVKDIDTDAHPYTLKLQTLLEKNVANKNWKIDTEGCPGEKTKRMLDRLSHILKKKGSGYYKYVVILGGTNDLAQPQTPTDKDIFANLTQMYEVAVKYGAQPIAVTIPEANFPEELNISTANIKDYLNRRSGVNERIRALAKKNVRQPVGFIDLEYALPQPRPAHPELSDLWSDHLHFSALGYDAFGELVFRAIYDAESRVEPCETPAKRGWCAIL